MTAAQVRVDPTVLTEEAQSLIEDVIGKRYSDTVQRVVEDHLKQFAHRLATAAAPGVPGDWVAVPREPTEAMVEAGEYAAWDHANAMPAIRAHAAAYTAMLAAAPTPPTTHQGGAAEMREACARVADEVVLDVEYEARDCGRSLHEQEHAEIRVAKSIAADIRALPLPAAKAPQGWRHKKRGTVYHVIGEAELQNGNVKGLREGAVLTVYRADDGKLWARETGEFHDGRFELLSAAPSTLREGEGA